MKPSMESVSSSNVDEIGYDPQARELWITFKGGGSPYVYMNVPDTVYESMRNAGSKGRFVWSSLRDVYSFRRG